MPAGRWQSRVSATPGTSRTCFESNSPLLAAILRHHQVAVPWLRVNPFLADFHQDSPRIWCAALSVCRCYFWNARRSEPAPPVDARSRPRIGGDFFRSPHRHKIAAKSWSHLQKNGCPTWKSCHSPKQRFTDLKKKKNVPGENTQNTSIWKK